MDWGRIDERTVPLDEHSAILFAGYVMNSLGFRGRGGDERAG